MMLNIQALQQLSINRTDVGRYVAIDGTQVQAWVDQGPDYSPAHKNLMNRGMHGAGFGTHDRHFWGGRTLLVLTCPKTTLPLAWILPAANEPEPQAVTALIDVLYLVASTLSTTMAGRPFTRARCLPLGSHYRLGRRA
jgi:hypothetical protein